MTPLFRAELEDLLNIHSVDNACNMSDFELADYIMDVLNTLIVRNNVFEPVIPETHVDGVKPTNSIKLNGVKNAS